MKDEVVLETFIYITFSSVTDIPSRAACSAWYLWSCGAGGGAVGMIMCCDGGSGGRGKSSGMA